MNDYNETENGTTILPPAELQQFDTPRGTYGQYSAPNAKPAKKKSKALPVFGLLIGSFLLLMGVFSLIGGLRTPAPKEMKDTAYENITTYQNYHTEITVADRLGTATNGNEATADYYLGVFFDSEGACRYCVVRVNRNASVSQELNDYVSTKKKKLGKMQLDGYFSLQLVTETEGLSDLYNKGITAADERVRKKYGEAATGKFVMVYLADSEETYLAAIKASHRAAVYGGALFAFIGALLCLLCIRKIRKINKANSEQPPVAVPRNTQTTAPYTPIPQPPYPTYVPQEPTYAPPQPTYAPQTPYAQPQPTYPPQAPAYPQPGMEAYASNETQVLYADPQQAQYEAQQQNPYTAQQPAPEAYSSNETQVLYADPQQDDTGLNP